MIPMTGALIEARLPGRLLTAAVIFGLIAISVGLTALFNPRAFIDDAKGTGEFRAFLLGFIGLFPDSIQALITRIGGLGIAAFGGLMVYAAFFVTLGGSSSGVSNRDLKQMDQAVHEMKAVSAGKKQLYVNEVVDQFNIRRSGMIIEQTGPAEVKITDPASGKSAILDVERFYSGNILPFEAARALVEDAQKKMK
ncbi:hypothetical protein HYR69_02280 [Candidatus Sumerlaeota bacterium]|nr:hypothetical protein [Candidatus Sumerlaeota bacterium]